MSSIFEKIINREIPAHIVYEDEHVIGILDISQQTKGHTLVISKEPARDIYELSQKSASHLFAVVQKLSVAIKKAFRCEGINLVSNNEPIAGQTVFHFHMHILPRYKDDGVEFIFNHKHKIDEDEFKKRALLIKDSLS